MAEKVAESRTKVLDVAIQACNEYRGRKITMFELAKFLAPLSSSERQVVSEFTRLKVPTIAEIAALTGATGGLSG